jgi:hypothetical protein
MEMNMETVEQVDVGCAQLSAELVQIVLSHSRLPSVLVAMKIDHLWRSLARLRLRALVAKVDALSAMPFLIPRTRTMVFADDPYRRYATRVQDTTRVGTGPRGEPLRALTRLNLSYSSLYEWDVRILSEAVDCGVLLHVKELKLNTNKIGKGGMMYLALAFSNGALPSLTKLDVSYNNCGDQGVDHLSSAMSVGGIPRLEHLDVSFNCVGDEGVSRFVATLQKKATASASLTSLSFSNNNVTNTGVRILTSALQKSALSSLQHLDLTNVEVDHSFRKLLQREIDSGWFGDCVLCI